MGFANKLFKFKSVLQVEAGLNLQLGDSNDEAG